MELLRDLSGSHVFLSQQFQYFPPGGIIQCLKNDIHYFPLA
jgi:hypothetical protein